MIFSDNFVSVFCNDNQQLRNVYLFIFSAKSFVFSKVCVIVRFETAIFKQNRQENNIEWKKQQYFDITNFQTLRFSTFSSFCFFEAYVFIKRSKKQTIEYHWFNEHDQLRMFVFQMIDQFIQHDDNFSACKSIETSIVCIVILMFWIEINNLTLLHAFCICDWNDRTK